MYHGHHVDGRSSQPEVALLFWQFPFSLAVGTHVARDGRKGHFAGMGHEGGTPVTTAFGPTLLFVLYWFSGVLPFSGTPAPFQTVDEWCRENASAWCRRRRRRLVSAARSGGRPDPPLFLFATDPHFVWRLGNRVCSSQCRAWRPYLEVLSDYWIEFGVLGVQQVGNHLAHCARICSMPFSRLVAFLVPGILRAVRHFPLHIYPLQVLVEAGLVTLAGVRLEITDGLLEKSLDCLCPNSHEFCFRPFSWLSVTRTCRLCTELFLRLFRLSPRRIELVLDLGTHATPAALGGV